MACLIVEAMGSRQAITRCCERGWEAGVRPGMMLAHARALLGECDIHTMSHQPRRDHQALLALAQWAIRYSPKVAPDPPDGLLIDVTGSQRLFKGERSLLRRIGRDVQRLGFGCRAAIAPTLGAAWAVARYGADPLTTVPDEALRQTLAPLPPAALRLDPDTLDALAGLGVHRIEHLLALPREDLPSRFPDLLLRLDQAMGQAMETLTPIRPAEPIEVAREFDGPVKQVEAIELTVRDLIHQLAAKLHHRESGALRVAVRLTRSDLPPLDLGVSLSHPSRDEKHLWALLRPHVERAQMGFGVEAIHLRAPRVGPLPHQQAQRWVEAADSSHQRELGQMLDTLISRLGRGRVLRCERVASHQPEWAFRWEESCKAATRDRASEDTGRQLPGGLSGGHGARPSLLLAVPELIEVMAVTPDGPPSWLRWRELEARIIASYGPERIAGSWWTWIGQGPPTRDKPVPGPHPAGTRDYFRLQDEHGRWLWVYRQLESRHWFIHGLWA